MKTPAAAAPKPITPPKALPDEIQKKLAANVERARAATNASVRALQPPDDDDPDGGAADAGVGVDAAERDAGEDSGSQVDGDGGQDDADPADEPEGGKPAAREHPAKTLAALKRAGEARNLRQLEKLLGLEKGTLNPGDDRAFQALSAKREKVKKREEGVAAREKATVEREKKNVEENERLSNWDRQLNSKWGPVAAAREAYGRSDYAAAAKALPLIFHGDDLAKITQNIARATAGLSPAERRANQEREELARERAAWERQKREEQQGQTKAQKREQALKVVAGKIRGHKLEKHPELVLAVIDEHWDAELGAPKITPQKAADIALERKMKEARELGLAPAQRTPPPKPRPSIPPRPRVAPAAMLNAPPTATNGTTSDFDRNLEQRLEMNRQRARAITDGNLRRLGRR